MYSLEGEDVGLPCHVVRNSWHSYPVQMTRNIEEISMLQMELRYTEVERARRIYERYVLCIPTVKAWVRYAKFEMQNGEIGLARKCYERSVEELAEDGETVSLS